MSSDMPENNRELLISFVSVLFGGMAAGMKIIMGNNKKEDKDGE
jgi:hypothetical protein